MANKTQPTDAGVDAFLDSVPDPVRQADARALCALLSELSGEPATMWGSSMIGFGTQHYRYETGREGDWFLVGFSPRKAATTIYLTDGLQQHNEQLAALGPHTTGKDCLYVKRLADVDGAVLRDLLRTSVSNAKSQASG